MTDPCFWKRTGESMGGPVCSSVQPIRMTPEWCYATQRSNAQSCIQHIHTTNTNRNQWCPQKGATPNTMKLKTSIAAILSLLVLATLSACGPCGSRRDGGHGNPSGAGAVGELPRAEIVGAGGYPIDSPPSGAEILLPGEGQGIQGLPQGSSIGGQVRPGNRPPVLRTVARGQSVRVKRWTDENGKPRQEVCIVENGTPIPKDGREIKSEAGDAFVNGPDGKPVSRPAGVEVPADVMAAVFRKQGRIPR